VSTSLHELTVKYRPIADFDFSPLEPVMNDTVQFQYTGTPNVDDWTWDFIQKGQQDASSNFENPDHSFSKPGIIMVHLTVENEFGCTDTITKYIVVKAGINVFIPTGFTPNRDALNNVFRPTYENIRSTEFMVIDRWGEVMFRTNSLEGGWDGTYKGADVPDGVFTYLVKVVGMDDQSYVFNGTVTLIR
jgi:gliding motility-associated-like protein